MLFPAYANLVLRVGGADYRIKSLLSTILLGCICAFAWEVVAPNLLYYSIADPRDAFAYLFGVVVHFLAMRVVAG